MKKNQDLYDLIRSLTRTEKRYFTLDARKAGKRQSRYLSLFQAINKQDVYDEDKLKTQFKASLADDKARLYEAILRSMRDFRSHRSQIARIKELLLDATFLYERGLYLQSEERLDEAKIIATKLQDQLALLEINRELRRVINTLVRPSDAHALSALKQESTQTQALLAEELNYLDLHDELIRELHSRRRGMASTAKEEIREQHEAELFHPITPTSLRGQLRYFQARAIFHQLMGDPNGVYENFKAANQLWNQHPDYKIEEFNRYLDNAFNLLHATFQHPTAVREAATLLDHLSAEEPASAHDRLVLFQRTATYRLIYTINFDNQRPAQEVLAPIEVGLEQYDLNPISELTIRYNAATLHFIQNSPEACETWLLSIIDLRKNEVRPDIVLAARLLRIITLIDQEVDIEFLEAQIRSEQRQLNKLPEGRLLLFASWLLRSLKKMNQQIDSERRKLMEAAELEIQAKWHGLPLGLGELIERWLLAKRKNIPLTV